MEDLRKTLDTEKIRQSVASDEYFSKSKQWFDEVYHRPIAERTFFVMLMLLSVLTIFFSTITYFSMQPLSRTIPYTIYSDDIASEIPLIKKLRKTPGEDINLAIGRFLVSNYVKERESYRYDVVRLEWQMNRVQQVSGKAERNRYSQWMNAKNPASPFNKYGQNGIREVSIYDIKLDAFSYPGRATVYFTTDVTNNKTKQRNNWVANMTFRFPQLTVNQESNEVYQRNPDKKKFELAKQINFKVDEYNVREITGQ